MGWESARQEYLPNPTRRNWYWRLLKGAVEKGILKSEALGKDVLTGFLGEFGRKCYGEPVLKRKIRITAGQDRVMEALKFGKDEKIVPFRRKEPVYTLEWI